MNQKNFSELNLIPSLLKALEKTGYTNPTPIQSQVIPLILKNQDVLGIAQTGTGKTAAFSLPMLQLLSASPKRVKSYGVRALILSPTRELAAQIHQSILDYGQFLNIKSAVIFGGVGQGNQVRDLSRGLDVLVATPGRLLDLISQGYCKLDEVEIFVLDEADQMLDMGFMPDIKRIQTLIPQKRLSLFFSATMPEEIQKLAKDILKNPTRIEVTPQARTADKVEQFVYFVDKPNKLNLLFHLLQSNELFKVLVFVEMKHQANRITDHLTKSGIPAAAIHSNKSQGARQRALMDLKANKIRVLVATDIAARGIDIDGITHVINFDLSHIPESYVHRIGRTARAGNGGIAITFVTAEEKSWLVAVEKTTRQRIKTVQKHPFHSAAAENAEVLSLADARAVMQRRREGNRPSARRGASNKRRPQARGGRASGGMREARSGGRPQARN